MSWLDTYQSSQSNQPAIEEEEEPLWLKAYNQSVIKPDQAKEDEYQRQITTERIDRLQAPGRLEEKALASPRIPEPTSSMTQSLPADESWRNIQEPSFAGETGGMASVLGFADEVIGTAAREFTDLIVGEDGAEQFLETVLSEDHMVGEKEPDSRIMRFLYNIGKSLEDFGRLPAAVAFGVTVTGNPIETAAEFAKFFPDMVTDFAWGLQYPMAPNDPRVQEALRRIEEDVVAHGLGLAIGIKGLKAPGEMAKQPLERELEGRAQHQRIAEEAEFQAAKAQHGAEKGLRKAEMKDVEQQTIPIEPARLEMERPDWQFYMDAQHLKDWQWNSKYQGVPRPSIVEVDNWMRQFEQPQKPKEAKKKKKVSAKPVEPVTPVSHIPREEPATRRPQPEPTAEPAPEPIEALRGRDIEIKEGQTVDVHKAKWKYPRKVKIQGISRDTEGKPLGVFDKSGEHYPISEVEIPQSTKSLRTYNQALSTLPKEERIKAREDSKKFDDEVLNNMDLFLKEPELTEASYEVFISPHKIGYGKEAKLTSAWKDRLRHEAAKELGIEDVTNPVQRAAYLPKLEEWIKSKRPKEEVPAEIPEGVPAVSLIGEEVKIGGEKYKVSELPGAEGVKFTDGDTFIKDHFDKVEIDQVVAKPTFKTEMTEAGEQVTFAGQRQVPTEKIRETGKKVRAKPEQGDVFQKGKIEYGNLPQDQGTFDIGFMGTPEALKNLGKTLTRPIKGTLNAIENKTNLVLRAKISKATKDIKPRDPGVGSVFQTPLNYVERAKMAGAPRATLREMALTEREMMIERGTLKAATNEILKTIDKKDRVKLADVDLANKPYTQIRNRTDISETTKVAFNALETTFENFKKMIISTLRENSRKSTEAEVRVILHEKGVKRVKAEQLKSWTDRMLEEKFPDSWGVEEYLPLTHIGQYRLFEKIPKYDETGAFVGYERKFFGNAETRGKAVRSLADYCKENKLDVKKVTYEFRDYNNTDLLRTTTAQKYWLAGQLEHFLKIDQKQIIDAMRGVVGTKAGRQKYFGSLIKRKGAKGYLDLKYLDRIMDNYIEGLVRWKGLSALNRKVQPVIEALQKQGRQKTAEYLTGVFEYQWGKQAKSSQLFDQTVQRIPGVRDIVKPFLLDRFVNNIIKRPLAHVLLKWSPRFNILNSLQTIQTLAPITNEAMFVKGRAMFYTKEGRAILEKHGIDYLLAGKHMEVGMKPKDIRKRTFDWSALKPEATNQGVSFLTMYYDALEKGMSEKLAADYAFLRGNVHSQFFPLKADTPPFLRGPIGSTIFMFKRFPIKALEQFGLLCRDKNISGMTKFIAGQMLVGGLRAVTGIAGKGWLTKQGYDSIDESFGGTIANLVAFGLSSLINMDMSYSVQLLDMPFGKTWPEKIGNLLMGPALNITWSLRQAAVDTKGTEPSAAMRTLRAAQQRIPAFKWTYALEKVIKGSEEGKYDFKTPSGKLDFKGDLMDVIAYGLGGRPIEKGKVAIWTDAIFQVQANRDKVLDDLASNFISKDTIKIQSIYDWNEQWGDIAIIRQEDVKNRIRSRMKDMDKTLQERILQRMGRAFRSSEEWQLGD